MTIGGRSGLYLFGRRLLGWYGILFSLGLAWIDHQIRSQWKSLPDRDKGRLSDPEDWLLPLLAAALLGARLGDALFYGGSAPYPNWYQYLKFPWSGLSFHGGVLGVCLGLLFLSLAYSVRLLFLSDLFIQPLPWAIFLVRIGNFINGELYGRPTTLPWGVIFLRSGDKRRRHPTQIYEALLEGPLIGILLRRQKSVQEVQEGRITATFLLAYAFIRFGVEYFREADFDLKLGPLQFTIGQGLCFPMFGIGLVIGLCLRLRRTVGVGTEGEKGYF